MDLADFMTREGLDDEAMAARVRARKIKCDRTMIYRYRIKKRRPEWRIINCIADITMNEVTANDWAKTAEATAQ